MTKSIGAIGTSHPIVPQNTQASKENLKRVAREFESILVHQLLDAAKVGGEGAQSGYGAMATDALSSGVSQAGGLGLARQVEEALTRAKAR